LGETAQQRLAIVACGKEKGVGLLLGPVIGQGRLAHPPAAIEDNQFGLTTGVASIQIAQLAFTIA
jgi:hypothetical protein